MTTSEITYNFEAEDFHTYFVGENGILVHNQCEQIAQEVLEGYRPTYKNEIYESNPKHGSIKKGKVSKGVSVEYGQYALDNSVVAGSSRMTYNGKDFIVFKQHIPNVWHGYTTDFSGLSGCPSQMNVARKIFNVWR